jgi:hypothetical protein
MLLPARDAAVIVLRGAPPLPAGRRARRARRCCCARRVTAAISVQPPPRDGDGCYTLSVRVPTAERCMSAVANTVRLDSAVPLAAAAGLIALGQLWRTWTVGWGDAPPRGGATWREQGRLAAAASQAQDAQPDTAPLGARATCAACVRVPRVAAGSRRSCTRRCATCWAAVSPPLRLRLQRNGLR